MNEVLAAAFDVEKFLRMQGWKYCLIGGLAVLRWGQTRTTQDVDISLLTGFGRESVFFDLLLQRFSGRITDVRQFAEMNRVLLLKSESGIGIDIGLAAFPFEEKMIERASPYEFESGITLTTASAEDLVIMKAFAGRKRDWIDVTGIIQLQLRRLDWHYIDEVLAGLQEMRPETDFIAQLTAIRKAEGAK